MSSPAKINLRLKVLGKRPDGFHELDTIFQEIALADTLEFHPSREWHLDISGMELDAGESNLVTRAARALAREANVPCRARIVLHKVIPSGGGLGGGSSNAAITLLGLSRLWGLGWEATRLEPLAAHLGSDCTFFLYGGLARGSGRGEVIDLIDHRIDRSIVLVIPPFGISTAEVFGWSEFSLTDDEKNVILEFRKNLYWPNLTDSSFYCNDLEILVLSRYDELNRIKSEFLREGAECALLSGSGSCIFAAYSDPSRALRAAQQFREPYRTVISHTVSRPRLRV